MLEQVVAGQTRWAFPGIAADGRGIAIGRFGLVVFPSFDGLVTWIRLFAAEDSLDELASGFLMGQVRTKLKSAAMILRFPVSNSYLLDKATRYAKLSGGRVFTGSGPHFLKYRDESAPLGYDYRDVLPTAGDADFILLDTTYVQEFRMEKQLTLRQLILRLQVRKRPEAMRRQDEEELVATVPVGLLEGIIRYTSRAKVNGGVTLFEKPGRGGNAPVALLLLRQIPARIVAALYGVPGIKLYRRMTSQVAVELDHAHPIALSSCSAAFENDEWVLLSGQGEVTLIAGPVVFSDMDHLLSSKDFAQEEHKVGTYPQAPQLEISLRLAPSSSQNQPVRGTLVAAAEAGWLRKMAYFLPQLLLEGLRIAPCAFGYVLLHDGDITTLPLGVPLCEIAPRVWIPRGTDLWPRIGQGPLSSLLGSKDASDSIVVFAMQGDWCRVSIGNFQPFARSVAPQLGRDEPTPFGQDLALGKPWVVSQDVGRFALWGVSSEVEET